MKKVLGILLAVSIIGTAGADIHTPPADRYTPVRKLSRGLANIIYGVLEIPSTFEVTIEDEGATAAFSYGIINGFERTGARIGYGFYEVVNFRTPKRYGTFMPPYPPLSIDSVHGYTEFPPQIGFASASENVQTDARQ